MEGKVFYVWFDAPIEYIAGRRGMGATRSGRRRGRLASAGGAPTRARRTSRYVQFMGKDNVPFHTLCFPATILGSGEPWKLVDYIKSFNYLNYDGGKFSTSQGRGVFMDQALEILPADYWRWWLMSNAPESVGQRTSPGRASRPAVNKDLADVLGNFVSRVTKFAAARFGGDGARRAATTARRRRR